MRQPIRISWGPRVMTIMVMERSKKVSESDSGDLCHTVTQRYKSSSPSHFICVINFEKTIMVSMLSRSWSDLHQSSPLSSSESIEDSVSRSNVDRERGERHLSSQVTSEVWLWSCPGSVFMLRWFTRCHVSHSSWHVMPRCHAANICPGVAQHCHNGSRNPGAKLDSSNTSSTN